MGFDPVKEGVIELGRISGNFDVVTSRHRLQPEQEYCVRQHGSSGTRTRIVCEAIRVVGRTAPVAVVAGGALKHQSGHRECHRQRKRKGGRRDGVNRHQSATDKGKGKEGEDCEDIEIGYRADMTVCEVDCSSARKHWASSSCSRPLLISALIADHHISSHS